MSGLSQIKHVVVLMFENRSFDNVLGWLYPDNASFNGLNNCTIQCSGVSPGSTTNMTNPNPDPNEEYQFVYNQMWDAGTAQPIPSPPSTPPSMTGFVADYTTAPNVTTPDNIMLSFEPTSIPVISTLAQWYAVCDNWFASVPTQTLANRSFVAAGTSSGYVNNQWKTSSFPYVDFLINATPTVFNVLEDHSVPWRVYYGGPSPLFAISLTTQEQLIAYSGLVPHFPRRFYPLSQFYTDIQSEETFPSYVFLEPNYLSNPFTGIENDEHPQASPTWMEEDGPSNVLFGEQLLYDVFTALTQSPAWNSTLFIVLFDEHGGTFDHVPPPMTNIPPPDNVVIPYGEPGGSGFTFDRLGVRVPAVLISPLIAKGTIDSTQYDHTSVIKTVLNASNITTTVGAREAAATDVSGVLTLSTPRTDLPSITPIPPPTLAVADIPNDFPLTEFQKTLLMLAAKRSALPFADVHTHGDAMALLSKLQTG